MLDFHTSSVDARCSDLTSVFNSDTADIVVGEPVTSSPAYLRLYKILYSPSVRNKEQQQIVAESS